MLNEQKHRLIMGEILREIYSDTSLAPLLGFKGGTCAYFFYDLPRFSVDLDFDFLGEAEDSKHQLVLEKINAILEKYGTVKDLRVKRFTIFALLSYGEADHNIKIEISIRSKFENLRAYYEIKEYAGISVLAAKKEYAFAMKLVALTQRKMLVMRDVYDIYVFAKNRWDIDVKIIEVMTGKKLKDYLNDCIAIVEKIKDNQVLDGLGELLNAKEKDWVRKNLKTEAVFQLKNYQASMREK